MQPNTKSNKIISFIIVILFLFLIFWVAGKQEEKKNEIIGISGKGMFFLKDYVNKNPKAVIAECEYQGEKVFNTLPEIGLIGGSYIYSGEGVELKACGTATPNNKRCEEILTTCNAIYNPNYGETPKKDIYNLNPNLDDTNILWEEGVFVLTMNQEIKVNKDQKMQIISEDNVVKTRDTFVITGFENSPCPPGAACIWSGQDVYYEMVVGGKVYQKTEPLQQIADLPYTIQITDSDYTTYAKVMINKK